MIDLEAKYLDFIRAFVFFYCYKKAFVRVILKTSNDVLQKRRYCLDCIENTQSIREDFNYVDIKYLIIKEEHSLFIDFDEALNPSELSARARTCDNCEKKIKRFRFAEQKPCKKCCSLITNNEFMKKVINSFDVEQLPNVFKFHYFIKNHNEQLVPDDAYNLRTIYHIRYSENIIWSEIKYFQSLTEVVKKEKNNQFNINNEPLKLTDNLHLFDEENRKSVILESIRNHFRPSRI